MISTVVFDLGGVLIDWNPRHLYRKLLADEAEIEHFLSKVCTQAWNEHQDAGRSLSDATEERIQKFPEHRALIEAYYGRWEEMLGGAINGTVDILKELHQVQRHRLLALTNFSAETYPVAQREFDFLGHFEGVLVSGEEKLKKPDEAIFRLLLSRYELEARETLFIDDVAHNCAAASAVGIQAIQQRNCAPHHR